MNFKTLSKSEGYIKLKESILKDIKDNKVCKKFNKTGCNQTENGIVCGHTPCDKFKWIIDRVRHYAHVTGLPPEEILNAWERRRTYWYQNFYGDSKQPKFKSGKKIIILNTPEEAQKWNKEGFRCSACSKVSKEPYKCPYCGWSVYGLLQDLGKGVYVFFKSKAEGERIFMPVAEENNFND